MKANKTTSLFKQFILDNYKGKKDKEIIEDFYNKYGIRYTQGYVSKIKRQNNLCLYNKKNMELHNQFIIDNYLKYPRKDLLKMLNDKFNTNYTVQKIMWVAKRNNLHRTAKGKDGHIFTEEQKQWLYNNYNKYFVKTLTQKFNEKFGTSLIPLQISNFKAKRFLKANIKRKKDDPEYYEKVICNKKTKREVGEEFINNQGQVYIRVKRTLNDNRNNSYMLKSRYVWELHNGKVPEGYSIIHLDGNKQNNNIDNLKMVKRFAQQYINLQKINTNNKQLNEIVYQAIELQMRANERKNELL